MTEDKIKRMSTTALAYMGDAVYEVKIRELIVDRMPHDAGKAHHAAVRYVSAAGQARAARDMLESGFLTDEEAGLLKRARNHRSMSRPQHADPKEYKLATGLEAVFGYLHLRGDSARIDELAAEAIRILDTQA